jgi:ABC-2 type transport system ATP-binding protein
MTCGRVIIIHRGQIAAVDSPQNLRRKLNQAGTIRLEGHFPDPAGAAQELERLEGIESLRSLDVGGGWQRIELILAAEGERDLRPEIFQLAGQRGWTLRELTRLAVSLEDVFTRLTQTEETSANAAHE